MNKNLIDMTGQKFGKLLVLYRSENRISPSGNIVTRWHCKCDCGNELDVDAYALRSGNTKSCGCHQHCKPIKDITGNKYGKLTVLSLNRSENNITYWNCLCECGNTTIVSKSNLLNGNTKSCGCLHSLGEHIIENLLIEHKFKYKRSYKFNDLVGPGNGLLMFDFAIFHKNRLLCLIEYQGEQHYRDTSFGKVQREITDKLKVDYCKNKNIPLFLIKYDENIEDAVHSILFSCMLMIVSSEETRRCNDYPETEYDCREILQSEAPYSCEFISQDEEIV